MIDLAWLDATLCVRLTLTLGHFLWQGLVIAVVALWAVAIFPRASARVRYGVFVGTLLLMAACPPVTFYVLSPAERAEVAPEVSATVQPVAAVHEPSGWPDSGAMLSDLGVDAASSAGSSAGDLRSDAVPADARSGFDWQLWALLTTLAYVAGTTAMLGRLALGLLGGERLRRRSGPLDDASVIAILTRQAESLALRLTPTVALCTDVVVPTVVGVLRSTILLPVSLASGLPPEHIEGILAHELAHIRRYDHIVNLMQRLIEALLFFHPAVWFVSRRVRIERKRCCDDLVLASGGEPLPYASALLAVAEFGRRSAVEKEADPAIALGVVGQPSDFRNRIRRILEGRYHESVRLKRPWAALICVTALLVVGSLLYVNISARAQPRSDSAPGQSEAKDSGLAWAHTVEGVRLGAASLAPKQLLGGKVLIRYALENRSNRSIRFYGGPSCGIRRVVSWFGGRITIVGPDGKPMRATKAGPYPSGGIDVKPDQIYQGQLDLANYFTFSRPGRYRVVLELKPHSSYDLKGRRTFRVSSGEFPLTLAAVAPQSGNGNGSEGRVEFNKDAPNNLVAGADTWARRPQTSGDGPSSRSFSSGNASLTVRVSLTVRGEKMDAPCRVCLLEGHQGRSGREIRGIARSDDATYRFSGLAAGAYTIEAYFSGSYPTHYEPIRLAAAEEKVVHIDSRTDQIARIRVEGLVLDSLTGKPIEGLRLHFVGAPDDDAFTDKNGRFATRGDRSRFHQTYLLKGKSRNRVYLPFMNSRMTEELARKLEFHVDPWSPVEEVKDEDQDGVFCDGRNCVICAQKEDKPDDAAGQSTGTAESKRQAEAESPASPQARATVGQAVREPIRLTDGEKKVVQIDSKTDEKARIRVEGVVLDARTGEPLEGLRLHFVGAPHDDALTDKHGRFAARGDRSRFNQTYLLKGKGFDGAYWARMNSHMTEELARKLEFHVDPWSLVVPARDEDQDGVFCDGRNCVVCAQREDKIDDAAGRNTDAALPEGQAEAESPANAQTGATFGKAVYRPNADSDMPRGSVSGVVVDAATGQPIAGAYVAIDHSGDAGGANLKRFRDQGIYVTAETDAQGRFKLEDVAFRDKHPLMVTRPGYVRQDEIVALRKDEPRIRVQVALQEGAMIEVAAVDAGGKPLEGETWFRLEAKAGAIFTPPRDDWPVTSTRMEKVKDGRCVFGELPAGAYSVDVLQIHQPWKEQAAKMRGKSLKEIREAVSALTAEVVYHAGSEPIVLEAGETKELRLAPGSHRSEVTVRIGEDPYLDPEQDYVAFYASRRPGRLLWVSNRFMHPEDYRLGRACVNNMLQTVFLPGQPCRLKNFPPGDYALFAATMGSYPNTKSPSLFLRGAKVEIREGLKKTVTIPWREPEGPSRAVPRALSTLNTTVPIESRSYTVSELCNLLTGKTGSRAEFTAAPTLRERSVTLSQSEVSIWKLLERLHLDQGWNLEVHEHQFTLTETK